MGVTEGAVHEWGTRPVGNEVQWYRGACPCGQHCAQDAAGGSIWLPSGGHRELG